MENLKLKTNTDKSAQERTATFDVGGMSCSSCANTVERTLSKLKGVESARVNYSDSSAAVVYKPDAVSPDQMKEAVEKVGYKLNAEAGEKEGKEGWRGCC